MNAKHADGAYFDKDMITFIEKAKHNIASVSFISPPELHKETSKNLIPNSKGINHSAYRRNDFLNMKHSKLQVNSRSNF